MLFCFNMEVILLVNGVQLMHKWWVYCQERIGRRLRCFLRKLHFGEELVFKDFIDLAIAELRWFWKAKSEAFIQYINAYAHCNSVKRSHITERANLGNRPYNHSNSFLQGMGMYLEIKKEVFPFFSEANFSTVGLLLLTPFELLEVSCPHFPGLTEGASSNWNGNVQSVEMFW